MMMMPGAFPGGDMMQFGNMPGGFMPEGFQPLPGFDPAAMGILPTFLPELNITETLIQNQQLLPPPEMIQQFLFSIGLTIDAINNFWTGTQNLNQAYTISANVTDAAPGSAGNEEIHVTFTDLDPGPGVAVGASVSSVHNHNNGDVTLYQNLGGDPPLPNIT